MKSKRNLLFSHKNIPLILFFICISYLSIIFLVDHVSSKKTILIIAPLESEKKEIKKPYLTREYDFLLYENPLLSIEVGKNGPILDQAVDIQAIVNEVVTKYPFIDGVASSRDYLGNIIASMVADRLNLPGPSPHIILKFQHKYEARKLQQHLVPEATPRFFAFNPAANIDNLSFPLFVKPIKSFLSMYADMVYSKEEFQKKLSKLTPSVQFAQPLTDLMKNSLPAHWILLEEPLSGFQCTLEGFIYDHKYHHVGITDSIMLNNTISFERFDYPSSLPLHIQNKMITIASQLMIAAGFNNSFFNIEFFYNKNDNTVKIIEVNPRICPQFIDLYKRVHYINTYKMMIDITAGKKPFVQKETGPYNCASSCVWRINENKIATSTPTLFEYNLLKSYIPNLYTKIFASEGKPLSSIMQDGKTYMYGIVHLSGVNKKSIESQNNFCKHMLNFEFSTF